jgi:hypothetical protein
MPARELEPSRPPAPPRPPSSPPSRPTEPPRQPGARQTIGQARAGDFSAPTTNYPCIAACEIGTAAGSGAAGEIRLLVSSVRIDFAGDGDQR